MTSLTLHNRPVVLALDWHYMDAFKVAVGSMMTHLRGSPPALVSKSRDTLLHELVKGPGSPIPGAALAYHKSVYTRFGPLKGFRSYEDMILIARELALGDVCEIPFLWFATGVTRVH
jgi:hypothetical protein